MVSTYTEPLKYRINQLLEKGLSNPEIARIVSAEFPIQAPVSKEYVSGRRVAWRYGSTGGAKRWNPKKRTAS